MERNTEKGLKEKVMLALLVAIELFAFLLLLFLFSSSTIAGVGQNVTVTTQLSIGNSAPEIINITADSGNSLDLIPNSTKRLTVVAIVRDYNGESDLSTVNARFFDNLASSYGAADDNNTHYTNSSCIIDSSYGDSNEANATCIFNVWYYANNASWAISFYLNDSFNISATSSTNLTINTLLAFGLPNAIDYGTVNATYVSEERIANITNFGNVMANLSLHGYAVTAGDNLSMNCTLGATKNISIYYEKYNLTASNTSTLSLVQFESAYANLTSNSSLIKRFNLNYQQNEGINEAINSTYWRIYVPPGVAGSCSGNIVFGARRSAGT